MTRSFVRKTYIDVPEIETFEWPPNWQPGKGKDQRFQGIIAGTSVGEILLISLEQKLSSFGGHQSQSNKHAQGNKTSFVPYRIEKKLADRNIKVSRRRCNTLAWNSVAHNLIAAGYERSTSKNDTSCLFVWDLNSAFRSDSSKKDSFNLFDDQVVGKLISSPNPETILDPKYQFKGVNDDVYSVCWLPGSETDLLAAIEDNLKICDTRQPWISNRFINDKHILNIKFDPFDDYRFACQTSSHIKIYDIRYN